MKKITFWLTTLPLMLIATFASADSNEYNNWMFTNANKDEVARVTVGNWDGKHSGWYTVKNLTGRTFSQICIKLTYASEGSGEFCRFRLGPGEETSKNSNIACGQESRYGGCIDADIVKIEY